MSLFITLVAMVVVFALLWIGISYLPDTPRAPWLRSALYVLLCVFAAFIVYTRFIA